MNGLHYFDALSSVTSFWVPSTTSTQHHVTITPAPELRRDALPNPQNNADSGQAAQSAAQAAQQASQSAAQAIQQANQSASQAAQQASQSASNAIQQAVQQASQSASNAVRSAQSSASSSVSIMSQSSASISSSASSAMASIQASASSAVVRANVAMSSALSSASLSQQQASSASSLAGLNVAHANAVAQQSQASAMTATQTAIAIVGSIIASTLLTALIFWLIIRYRKRVEKEKLAYQNPDGQENYDRKDEQEKNPREPQIRETFLSWNPKNPPRAPPLKNWLRLTPAPGSPLGPINLPNGKNANAPLGGQLKSPLRSLDTKPKLISNRDRDPYRPGGPMQMSTPGQMSTSDQSTLVPSKGELIFNNNRQPGQGHNRGQSSTTMWSGTENARPSTTDSTTLGTAHTHDLKMELPTAQRRRSTAEWLYDQDSQTYIRPSVLYSLEGASGNGLPPRPGVGLPMQIKNVKGEVRNVDGVKRSGSR